MDVEGWWVVLAVAGLSVTGKRLTGAVSFVEGGTSVAMVVSNWNFKKMIWFSQGCVALD